MGGKKGGMPSVDGVSWLDVYQVIAECRDNLLDGEALIEITTNGLGAFQLTTLVYFRMGKHRHVAETTEPWLPSKGRMEAFVYRSLLDSMKEAERQIARLSALIQ